MVDLQDCTVPGTSVSVPATVQIFSCTIVNSSLSTLQLSFPTFVFNLRQDHLPRSIVVDCTFLCLLQCVFSNQDDVFCFFCDLEMSSQSVNGRSLIVDLGFWIAFCCLLSTGVNVLSVVEGHYKEGSAPGTGYSYY